MKVLARIATRGTERDGKGTVDLLLGVGFKENTLKPDTIYELRETLGELTLVELGPSAARTEQKPLNIWASGVEAVMTAYRDRWLLTSAEWKALRAPDESDSESSLSAKRQAAAEAAFNAYDFGADVENCGGWEWTDPCTELTRTVFLRGGAPGADSERATFTVRFDGIDSSCIKEAYAITADGNSFGALALPLGI